MMILSIIGLTFVWLVFGFFAARMEIIDFGNEVDGLSWIMFLAGPLGWLLSFVCASEYACRRKAHFLDKIPVPKISIPKIPVIKFVKNKVNGQSLGKIFFRV